jgi:glycerophosphoryl diester phosphodiesterase
MARPLVLAHRGARQVAPENTLEAFTTALALGADGVELDVHRTHDAGLVVHHDAEASDIGLLAEHGLAEIRAARADIPTLAESLDACSGSLVNIEIKNLPGDADFDPDDMVADLVVDQLSARSRGDKVLISSFNLATIDRVHALDESLPTAFLVILGLEPIAAVELCHEHGHSTLHPFIGMLAGNAASEVAARAHALGLHTNTWTVNDPEEMRRVADAGVDGIVTDVPDVALATFGGGPIS